MTPTMEHQDITESIRRIDALRESEIKRIDEKVRDGDVKYQIQFSAAEKALGIALTAQEKQVAATDVVSGVTYNGVAMTRIIATHATYWTYLYILYAPASGANNIVVTAPGAAFVGAAAVSYNNAAQSGNVLNSLVNAGGGTSYTAWSVTVPLTYTNSWVAGFYYNDPGNIATAGSGTTLRTQGVNGQTAFDSNASVGAVSSYILNANMTSANGQGFQGFEIVDVSPTSAATPKSILGLVWSSWF